MTTVEGTINGAPVVAHLESDGQRSHWLKVTRALAKAAGDTVTLEIMPVAEEPEPNVPTDLRKALAATPEARVVWRAINAIARRDWIHWIVYGKRAETRTRRVETACSMLASRKRRPCCFDRSGVYSKGLSAPKAAE